MKRRAFLLAASVTGVALAATTGLDQGGQVEVDPAAFLTSRLESVLLGAPPASAVTSSLRLLSALATATSDFRACRYVQLAVALPELIAAAQATSDATSHPDVTTTLANAYNLATRALIKLESSGLEWIAADRALDLTMQAADQLDVRGPRPPMAHLARYGVLLCSAGYARARANDRDRALDLLGEAAATVARLDQHPVQQAALRANVLSHRVSAEYVLGNAGIALHHADRATADSFPDTERRGRFLVDVALCFNQLGKPREAFIKLLEAERAAPAEVRTRATVRDLVTELREHRNSVAMPGLAELAVRTHVA